jgi:hypothetical protein
MERRAADATMERRAADATMERRGGCGGGRARLVSRGCGCGCVAKETERGRGCDGGPGSRCVGGLVSRGCGCVVSGVMGARRIWCMTRVDRDGGGGGFGGLCGCVSFCLISVL